MSGIRNGVQAFVKQEERKAFVCALLSTQPELMPSRCFKNVKFHSKYNGFYL